MTNQKIPFTKQDEVIEDSDTDSSIVSEALVAGQSINKKFLNKELI
jgi:hypothetical protein